MSELQYLLIIFESITLQVWQGCHIYNINVQMHNHFTMKEIHCQIGLDRQGNPMPIEAIQRLFPSAFTLKPLK